MKIALIGYGRMGREIEKVTLKKGHDIALIIDLENCDDLVSDNLIGIDVAIEFSQPESAPENIIKCLKAGIPVVSGTTGWNSRFEEVIREVDRHKGTLMYASNFSIGVNTLFSINRQLAAVMNRLNSYNPSIKEVHHIMKIDAPSGTAITLAGDIIEATEWEGWTPGEKQLGNNFPVQSVREGDVPGIHEITWKSESDTLSLRHEAFNRSGFANGAVLAAEFVIGRKGLLTMNDLLGF